MTYAEGATVPISVAARDYPMADALQPLFPTLIGRGMQYFELKSDAENGTLAQSDTPLNVSSYLDFVLTIS